MSGAEVASTSHTSPTSYSLSPRHRGHPYRLRSTEHSPQLCVIPPMHAPLPMRVLATISTLMARYAPLRDSVPSLVCPRPVIGGTPRVPVQRKRVPQPVRPVSGRSSRFCGWKCVKHSCWYPSMNACPNLRALAFGSIRRFVRLSLLGSHRFGWCQVFSVQVMDTSNLASRACNRWLLTKALCRAAHPSPVADITEGINLCVL